MRRYSGVWSDEYRRRLDSQNSHPCLRSVRFVFSLDDVFSPRRSEFFMAFGRLGSDVSILSDVCWQSDISAMETFSKEKLPWGETAYIELKLTALNCSDSNNNDS